MFNNKSRGEGEGVVIGNMGIDPSRDDYEFSGLEELPDSDISGICPHGNLLDTRCTLCAEDVNNKYGKLMKTPRRKR